MQHNVGVNHKLSAHANTWTVRSYNNTLKWGIKATNIPPQIISLHAQT